MGVLQQMPACLFWKPGSSCGERAWSSQWCILLFSPWGGPLVCGMASGASLFTSPEVKSCLLSESGRDFSLALTLKVFPLLLLFQDLQLLFSEEPGAFHCPATLGSEIANIKVPRSQLPVVWPAKSFLSSCLLPQQEVSFCLPL